MVVSVSTVSAVVLSIYVVHVLEARVGRGRFSRVNKDNTGIGRVKYLKIYSLWMGM